MDVRILCPLFGTMFFHKPSELALLSVRSPAAPARMLRLHTGRSLSFETSYAFIPHNSGGEARSYTFQRHFQAVGQVANSTIEPGEHQ